MTDILHLLWSFRSVQQRMILRDSLLTRQAGRNLEGNQREILNMMGANANSIQNSIPDCLVTIMRGITIWNIFFIEIIFQVVFTPVNQLRRPGTTMEEAAEVQLPAELSELDESRGNNTTVNTIQYSEYTHHQWHNPQPLSPRPQQFVHPARSAIFMAADGHMVNEHNQQVNHLGEPTDQV